MTRESENGLGTKLPVMLLAMGVVLALAPGLEAQALVEGFAPSPFFGGTTGRDNTFDDYEVSSRACTVNAVPGEVSEVEAVSEEVLAALADEFPTSDGWSYEISPTPLSAGSVRLRTHDVSSDGVLVGIEVHLDYLPTKDSADPAANAHWIRWHQNDHAIGEQHGTEFEGLDVTEFNTTPYLEEFGTAMGGPCDPVCHAILKSARLDTDQDHIVRSEVYLVDGPAIEDGPGPITIFLPGFEFGWVNECGGKVTSLLYTSMNPKEVEATSDKALEPGAAVEVKIAAGEILLEKGPIEAKVRLLGASLRARIEDQVDAAGLSRFEITGGGGEFAAYLFGKDVVGKSTFEVLEGHGYVQWDSKEASGKLKVRVKAAGYPDIIAVAQGRGTVDPERGLLTLSPNAEAFEIEGLVTGR